MIHQPLMDALPPTSSLTGLRWTVVGATLGVCAALMTLLTRSVSAPLAIETLGLLALGLVVYASMLLPIAAGVVISLVVGVTLVWAWAVNGGGLLGRQVLLLAVLLVAAGWERRRRTRRALRLQQVIEDFAEEQTAKEQAITLANQNRDALQKKLARYTQLQSIADALSGMTNSMEAIGRLAVEQTFSLIGKSDVCLLFLVDKKRQELSLSASKKREGKLTIRTKHGDQFDRYVLRTHRPLLVNDVRRDFRFTVSVSSDRTISSVIACPLILGSSPEGVLRLDSSEPAAYTQDDLRLLDILLDLVSAAMTNARLFAQTQQLAMTDGLTGLHLRRPFLEQLSRELTRATRRREPLSIIMLDVDHFKRFNDSFGHSVGDIVLKSVAQVLREVVPSDGLSARYGGEEFAVLLPRVGRAQAAEVAEQIRQRVAQQVQERAPLPTRARRSDANAPEHESGGVTVSVGVASFPDDAQGDLELIRLADQRLYAAKHAGRNQVVCT